MQAGIDRICEGANIRVRLTPLDHPSVLMPPICGTFRILIDSDLHRPTRGFALRHEIGHVLTGDADEPTVLHFEGPLPEAETVADLFAFADLITRDECGQGVDYVVKRMRELVVLDYAPWYLRMPELAPRLNRLRSYLD